MLDLITTDDTTDEQTQRMRRMFAAVVLETLDEYVELSYTMGMDYAIKTCERWANSSDGYTVLTCAGVEPRPRVTAELVAFVARGKSTSRALSRTLGGRDE